MNDDQKERISKLRDKLERIWISVEKQEEVEEWLETNTLCFNLCNEGLEYEVYKTIIAVIEEQLAIQKNVSL